MIFEIDQTIVDLFSGGSATQEDFNCLDYLALGSAEGSHRIVGRRSVLSSVAAVDGITERAKAIFARAASRASQEGSLRNNLSAKGVVAATHQAEPISAATSNQRIITIPLRWFDSSSKIQPTVLLGEHVNDALVLLKIGEVGSHFAGIPYVPINMTPDHGGGSSTGTVLKLNNTQKKICLCIVDSDVSHPGGPMGNTASCVQPYKDQTIYPLIQVIETAGRDLENCLPSLFYTSEYAADSFSLFFSELVNSGDLESTLHFDVEKGLSLRKLLSHDMCHDAKSFWSSKIPSLLSLNCQSGKSFPCLTSGVCSEPAKQPCKCLISGNPSDILDRFVEKYCNLDRFYLASLIDPSIKPEWIRLGLAVCSWGCGDTRLRI